MTNPGGITVEALDLPNVSWRKSTFSGNNGECVEVAALTTGEIAIRNSNHPDRGTVLFTRTQVAALLNGIKANEFDDLRSTVTA